MSAIQKSVWPAGTFSFSLLIIFLACIILGEDGESVSQKITRRTIVMNYNRTYNFSAGPATMPEPVLEAIRDEMMDVYIIRILGNIQVAAIRDVAEIAVLAGRHHMDIAVLLRFGDGFLGPRAGLHIAAGSQDPHLHELQDPCRQRFHVQHPQLLGDLLLRQGLQVLKEHRRPGRDGEAEH